VIRAKTDRRVPPGSRGDLASLVADDRIVETASVQAATAGEKRRLERVMKVFRDLHISATAESMAAAVAAMEQAAGSAWVRDKTAEARAQAFPALTKRMSYCFARKTDAHRPGAMLILAQKDPHSFYVSNIVPLERHQLEHADYNAVLEDFYEHVFKPYADKAGLAHTLTAPEADLERWMDAPTAELLRTFSECANKGTGVSHPDDRTRWNAFMLSAHQNGIHLDPATLARWLVEAEEWPPEVAEQLALEYESGLGLLAYANSR
jgi:hypothetical protein